MDDCGFARMIVGIVRMIGALHGWLRLCTDDWCSARMIGGFARMIYGFARMIAALLGWFWHEVKKAIELYERRFRITETSSSFPAEVSWAWSAQRMVTSHETYTSKRCRVGWTL
jgi:hypothetical protein